MPDTDNPHVALYSLNPPGSLYLTTVFDTKEIIPCVSQNWDSALVAPQFNEGYFRFKDIQYNKNLCMVVDIRKIIFSAKGTKYKVEKVGWTIVPLFHAN